MTPNKSERSGRQANWDLLRSIAMFAVVVVHCGGPYLGQIGAVNLGVIVSRAAIACDPVFFALSGYFALRPLKRGLRDYYQRKLIGIVMPLVVYSVLLYLWSTRLAGVSLGSYFAFAAGKMGSSWWFIPSLIPFLVLSPFLYLLFEALSDEWALRLSKIVLATSIWSCLNHFGQWLFLAIGKPGAASLVETTSYLAPTHLVPVGYFVFFCSGYFLRRVLPGLDEAKKRRLVITGFGLWALDVLANYVGVPASDPSDYWFWVVIALFIVFGRIEIDSASPVGKVLRWTGERSYSIYLLQSSLIYAVGSVLYEGALFGAVSCMPWYMRVAVWILLVIASYGMSLILASILDTLALKPVQAVCRRTLERIC